MISETRLAGIAVFTLLAVCLTAQQNPSSATTPRDSRKDALSGGTLRGQVADESGAVIPGATVTLTNFAGVAKTLKTGPDGTFSAPGLPPGRYTVRAFATGMALYENTAVEIGAGESPLLKITMKVGLEKQQITVQDQPGTTVNTDPAYNVGALLLKGEDLDALPDDPD